MRKSGILLPITSLPGRFGIGDFSKNAYEFADFLKMSKQSFWQILPIGPTGFGNSPYQSFSSFAGNPYMVSLEKLIEEELLTEKECVQIYCDTKDDCIDYSYLYKTRFKLLKKAYKRSGTQKSNEYMLFTENNKFWLDDYALFMSLKENFNNLEWLKWPDKFKNHNIDKDDISDLKDEIEFWKYVQFKFYTQWKELKSYANKQGISIIGDIPIYVSMDSSDTWSNPHLFQLNSKKIPTNVAGCPPDGFSEDGQLWGNPLYNWKAHEKENYAWWISRIKHCFELFDYVRIDHFRGFDEYYSIPYGNENAKIGCWEKGPGINLFKAVEKEIGKKNIIAEDLGFITDSVKKLLRDCDYSGIKVLEFAFDERDTGVCSDYLPHNYPYNCVAYTGTHDNQTLFSWFKDLSEKEKSNVRKYLCDFYTPDEKMHKSLICSLMRSNAKISIIPLQDVLGLSDNSRINIPGTIENNWEWRVKKEQLSKETIKFLSEITALYDRT